MSYKPKPDNLIIKESPIHGLGLFTLTDLIICNPGLPHCLVETHLDLDGELFRINVGGFINHSKDPNCTLYPTLAADTYTVYSLTIIRDIKADEELTLDYTKELCGLTDYTEEEWLK